MSSVQPCLRLCAAGNVSASRAPECGPGSTPTTSSRCTPRQTRSCGHVETRPSFDIASDRERTPVMSDPGDAPTAKEGPGRAGEDLSDDFEVFLAGVRTSLPGSRVLVAFLLVLPLQAGFGETDEVEQGVFLVSFMPAWCRQLRVRRLASGTTAGAPSGRRSTSARSRVVRRRGGPDPLTRRPRAGRRRRAPAHLRGFRLRVSTRGRRFRRPR